MANLIDVSKLSDALKARRGSRGLREVAQEITETIGPVSASTLSRIEQGKIPDLDTFVKVCKWLGLSADQFVVEKEPQKTDTPKAIEAHLRADKVLNPDTIKALSEMIRLAYSAAKSQRERKR